MDDRVSRLDTDGTASRELSRRDLLRTGVSIGIGLVAFGSPLRSARAQGKKVVKLSFIAPLTGGTASNGLGGRNSFLLAVAERNADPRSKYRYETIVLDDECKPTVGVQAALKAGSDPEVIASVSHYCSVVAIATVDSFHKLGLPSMVWGAVLPDITYSHKHVEVTRVNGTMINQNHIAAAFAVKKLGFRTFSIIHDTTDYGRGHAKYFTEGLEKVGGKILSVTGTAKDQKDYAAELTKVKAEKPEVIYYGGLTPDGVRVKVQMDKLGVKAQFQGTSGIKSDTFIETAGPSAEGVYCFVEGAPTEKLPGGKRFLEAYAKMNFKEPSEAYGPFAYVATHLVIDTIEEVGPDRAKVAQRLKRMKKQDTIIGPVEFDEHGQNTVPLITTHVAQDGKWVVWEDSEYAAGKRELPGLRFKRERG
ncbi:MAG: branched-chain amino acid ABC transporter substrate-binding protein [Candidatus Rokubacteria bacterium]|nr:branched-chain amino acid ABC transporter substrate-binding protein [Candidatus Rokubacteria bacterium]